MVAELIRSPSFTPLCVTWELLPDDYPIPDDPVDNRTQPALAAALTDSLNQADRLPPESITITNYPLCATLNGNTVLKAPDWAYISKITVPKAAVNRSYTPHKQGEPPTIVMEFLSHQEGGEYSNKPSYPPGKWFFYEQILKVPYYAIFEPESGSLELYHLKPEGRYKIQDKLPDTGNNDRYWIEPLQLFLGVWQGHWQDRSGYWLRWWDKNHILLFWGTERAEHALQQAEQARQQAEQARQQAAQERQRSERLLAQLRAAGIEPEV